MTVAAHTGREGWEGGWGRPGAQLGRDIYEPENKLILEMMWP